jgi:hypothetical protein
VYLVLERRDRAWPERVDHRLPESRVVRRIEHREAANRTLQRGVGRTLVVVQQLLPMEDGALDDRKALPVRQHLPHVVESGQGVRVVGLDAVRTVTRSQFAVDRERIAHHGG